MAIAATYIWVFNWSVRNGAVGEQFDSFTKQGFDRSDGQHEVGAGIVPEDIRHLATFAQIARPQLGVFPGRKRTTFLKVATAIVVAIEEFALSAVRRLHALCYTRVR